MSRDPIESFFGTKLGDSNIVFTPEHIVKDMVDLLSDDFWTPDKKILDIYTKTGRFLKCTYDKLFASPHLAYMQPEERRQHILNKQLYGICANTTLMLMAQQLVYGRVHLAPCNIIYIENYEKWSIIKTKDFYMKH